MTVLFQGQQARVINFHLLTNHNHDFHNHGNVDILTEQALQLILSKLRQVVCCLGRIQPGTWFMVLGNIKIVKNAQGKKALDIHISQLLKIEKT